MKIEEIKKVNLNNVCYSLFIEHLKERGIKYMEEKEVDIDYFMEEIIVVTPLESRVKERYFSTDGGHQLHYD
jgi:hypothetical protein